MRQKIKRKSKKQVAMLNFFSVFAVVAASLLGGIAYLKSDGFQSSPITLADDASTVPGAAIGSSIALASTTTTTIVAPPIIGTVTTTTVATTTQPVPQPIAPATVPPTTTISSVPVAPIVVKPAHYVRPLPYSIGTFGNTFGSNDGWTDWWDPNMHSDGVLTIRAASSTTANGALLEGSYAWTDYTFSAVVTWQKGQSFGLVARYVDDKNYTICKFDEKKIGTLRVSIEQVAEGKRKRLAVGDILNYNQLGGVGLTVAVRVWGNQAVCAFDGHTISTAVASTALTLGENDGQIGFLTEDPQEGNTEAIIQSVAVTREFYNLGTEDIKY